MKILVTGGAGFVGWNLCLALHQQGQEVVCLDDFSAPGSSLCAEWLGEAGIKVNRGSVTNRGQVAEAMKGCSVVFHLAAQTSVEGSLRAPGFDFDVNAVGTLNVCEEVRHIGVEKVIYNSTNKVYGSLDWLPVVLENRRWRPSFSSYRNGMVSHRFDPATPYGVSKGTGSMLVLDLEKTWGIQTWDLRLSCIAGQGQRGGEEQGWISWFVTAAIRNLPITIRGDGCQVRDILNVSDLVCLYQMILAGKIPSGSWDVGGGPDNAVSVWWDTKAIIEEVLWKPMIEPKMSPWRPSDQKWFVADVRPLAKYGWKPERNVKTTVEDLVAWTKDRPDVIDAGLRARGLL